jgi:AraC family transcriptional regulator
MQRSRLRPGSFLGQTLKTYRVDHLRLVESAYGPRFRSATHSHEHAFCYFVLEGSCTQICGRHRRTCVASNLVFHPAGEAHSDFWHGSGGRCLHVEFDAWWMERVREFSLALDRPFEFRGGMPVWLATRLYREVRAPDDTSPLAVEGLALELVAHAARESIADGSPRPPNWLRRVKELIQSRFREHLTLEELAREAGVHPVHLVTVFRRHLCCTPFDFLRRTRIAFAARKLIDTKMTLAEIALDAGFAHQSHFCRVFKSVTGTTPAAYRRCFRTRP